MNNKIEAGCRAVIVNSAAGNNGIVVTVLEKCEIKNELRDGSGQLWTLDQRVNCLRVYNDGSERMGTTTYMREEKLQRLPDEDANTKCEWDETIFKPEDLKIKEVVS